MMDQPLPLGDLLIRSQAARYESLQTDLELSHTFVDLANTEREIGDHTGVVQARTIAEEGYATISRLSLNLEDAVRRKEIQMGLDALRVALDELAASGEG
jgi:hypothetical protein